jgi:hypothetical protein
MSGEPVKDLQAGWLSGLNSVSDPAALTPDQARQLVNARLTTYGSATRRGGTRKVLTGAVAVSSTGNVGLYWPLKLQAIAMAGATQVLYAGGAPSAFTATWAMTMTARGTVSANTLCIFTDANAAEVVYGESQAGGLVKYDGSAATTVTAGTPVAVSGACVYDARLWGWNSAASPNSVYYSALNNGDTLGIAASNGGQIVVTTHAAASIVRCAPVGASLLIFHHPAGISRLTGFGSSDLSVSPQPATADLAICGPNALALYHNAAWVATAQGLYQVTEGGAQPVGSPERPDPTIAVLATSAYASSTIVYANRSTFEIWVMIPGTGVYAYNVLLGAWSGPFNGSIFAATAPGVPFEINDQTVLRRTVMPPDAAGMMYELDSPDYYKDGVDAAGTNGSAYNMVLQCHRMFGEDRSYSKSWRWVIPTAILSSGATAPTASIQSLYGGASTQTFATPSGNQDVYYLNGMGTGPYEDVTITDSGAAASEYFTVAVEGFVLGQR